MLFESTIAPADAGTKLSRYIQKALPQLSRARLHELFRKKEVKLRRKAESPHFVLETGMTIQVYGLKESELSRISHEKSCISLPLSPQPLHQQLPQPVLPSKPSNFTIPVLYEDEALLVLNKPSGLASQPGSGIPIGASVIEQVWTRPSSQLEWAPLFKPALAHRLDKETSGVLLIAKQSEALRQIHQAMKAHSARKQYFALVCNAPPVEKGSIRLSLLREDNPGSGSKTRVNEEGLTAITHYQVTEKMGKFHLLEVIIETGRTHQIRAHLAHINCPIAGDSRYGNFEENRRLKRDFGLRRLFLHAGRMELPLGTVPRVFTAPLADELKACLQALRSQS